MSKEDKCTTYTLDELNAMMAENGGGLDLSGTQITALPDNLTVGGWLYLSHTQITALPNNLTVGGWLDLRGTQITALPDNLTVGGGLDLSHTKITNSTAYTRLRNGDYKPGHYLYADGILTHIRAVKKIHGYTLYIGKIPGHNVVFDGTFYAHCRTLREGVADILFKHASERGAEQFKGLSLDDTLSFDEAVTAYRIITGACRQGTQQFIDSLPEKKERYTIREAIALTEGQYNAERFAEFFAG